MILQRKYEWLGVLYENDKQAKDAIDNAFSVENIAEDIKQELLDYNHYNIPAFLNLGCGIPGKCYALFMEAFEKLDAISPYDNGLTFNEVTSIEYESSRKGTAIQMRFVSKMYDMPYRIVGFAAVESKEGKIAINKGWQMTDPFTIG